MHSSWWHKTHYHAMYLNTSKTLIERRDFIRKLGMTGGFLAIPGLYSEALALTAPQLTQGPYYPLADDIPLDDDNDLVTLNDSTTAAKGTVHYLGGRILDASGNPVKNALVEIWHCDAPTTNTTAVQCQYVYSTGTGRNASMDTNFAGFGQFLTGSSGAYKFRTIKAGLYTGRTRHIHIAVTIPGQSNRYCTQVGWNETAVATNGTSWATQNSSDNVFGSLTTAQKALLLLDWTAVSGATAGEKQGAFDFQVNLTPTEPTYPVAGGCLYKGVPIAGPGSTVRYKITVPVYTGYEYEIYGNATLDDVSWRALPFSLTQTGTLDRNRHVATSTGSLDLYVTQLAAAKSAYKVSWRPVGNNFGVP